MNKNFSYIQPNSYLVNKDARIYEAMQVIEKGEERVCFIVNDKKKLLKVISDGDIRRALLKNQSLNAKVINIHNNKPKLIKEECIFEEAEKVLSKRILVAPVVNKNGIIRSIKA